MSAGSGPRRKLPSVRPSSRPSARPEDPKVFAVGVGEAVRRARQALGWTQSELAERSGLSSNYIARLERGELGPSLFVANQLCGALNIPVEALLHGAPSMRTTRRRIAG
jgi:ribosome-binding protein aMBF1 (putative translation factor)